MYVCMYVCMYACMHVEREREIEGEREKEREREREKREKERKRKRERDSERERERERDAVATLKVRVKEAHELVRLCVVISPPPRCSFARTGSHLHLSVFSFNCQNSNILDGNPGTGLLWISSTQNRKMIHHLPIWPLPLPPPPRPPTLLWALLVC